MTPPPALVRAAAALVRCDTLEDLRRRVAEAFVSSLRCRSVLLFEAGSGDTDLFVTWPVPDARDRIDLAFARDSDLVRWLTVNEAPLRVGAGEHLWDEWSSRDRDVCLRAQADLAVPFVADDDLVGVSLVVGLAAPLSAESELILQEFAQHVAVQWRQLAASERAAARARSLRRAHQLGSVGMLAATLAHEVRNPLAAIRSWVQFVRDAGPDAQEQRRVLSNIMREIDRVEASVKRTLDLSRPDAEAHCPVDLVELIQDVVAFLMPYAAKRRIAVRFDPPREALCAIGDVGALRQLLLNVLINACQACEFPGDVTIDLRSTTIDGAAQERVRVEVADTGVGLAPEQVASVFQAFYTTKPDGTGLGLTFCREAVERMGGTIEMRSALGLGSSVIIVLPGVAARYG